MPANFLDVGGGANQKQVTEAFKIILKSSKVKAIFVESSVNPAAIRRVAEDAGVKVGGELFSDAMGRAGEMKEGFDTGTYDGMVRCNMTTIVNALK